LAITKTSAQTAVRPGDTLTYTLTVKNNGPSAAIGATLNDTLPPGLTNAQYSANNGATWQAWSGTLPLGTMPMGASAVTLLRGTVATGVTGATGATGSISNTANVSSSTTDPNNANNSATLQTAVTPVQPPPPPQTSADLIVTGRASPATVQPGDTLTYTVTVNNTGPGAASSAVLTDTIPPALQNAQYSTNSGATWQVWNGSLPLGTIPMGAASETLLRATVAPSASGSISNTASVTSSVADPISGNNSITLQTMVGTPVTRLIPAVKCPCKASPCRPMTFTVELVNPGTQEAASVLLTDMLPDASCQTLYSLDNGCCWQTSQGKISLDNIPAGASSTLTLRKTCDCFACGTLNTHFELSYMLAGLGPFIEQISCLVPVMRC
jgi:uncharacterized repeat protein (TIGR01451 family)